ncbi:MAG: hypothetical protein FOGNACKC_03669 [Anaerolineae bacterium]|nr:hypothetical protein [Anaerolineae bacterium]
MKPAPLLTLSFDGQTAPARWPSVSLCMIVKNEAANLAGCLRSVGDLASEVIVVDTGSTDQTVDIAQALGARVEYFTWIDDFAAARNESLRHASGDWILWLDADDRLSPANVNQLKNAVASGQADAYRCRMVSPLAGENPASNQVFYTLLFKNHLGVQFEDPIHESVTESLLRRGLTIAHTNISIQHTGYSGDPASLRRKARRNAAILRRCVLEQPQRLKWRYHLGLSLYQLADYRGAIEQFEMIINHPAPELNANSHLYKAYILLMSAYTTLPDMARAEAVLQRGLALFPGRRHGWITAGMFYLRQNRPELARQCLERAQTLPPESDAEGESWAAGVLEAQLGLACRAAGLAALGREDFAAAIDALQTWVDVALPPERAEACKMLAVALQKSGRQSEALACWQLALQTPVAAPQASS